MSNASRYLLMQNQRDKENHKKGDANPTKELDKDAAETAAKEFNAETAREWVRNMRNEDGTKGEHWSEDQIGKLMAQRGIQYDTPEIFAVMNSLYSDYCKVLKKYGVTSSDAYLDLALAWLNDADAVKNKAAKYYECIVMH